MSTQPKTNRYTTDSRGERTPMPYVLRPANANLMSSQARSAPVSQPPQPAYSFDNPPPRERHRPEPTPAAEPGFYVVPYSMTAGELYRTLFDEMPTSAMRKYSALNPGLGA